MAEENNVVALDRLGSSNLTSTKKTIKEIVEKINEQKVERQSTNDEIANLRSKAETLGVPKAAPDMAMKYMNWDADKRYGFDAAYQIVREAIGLPVDLFSSADERSDENHASKPHETSRSVAGLGDAVDKADAASKA